MEVSNPTVSEIRDWAFSKEDWPDSEWPLFLAWSREIELFIELASNHKCPKQNFFRFMLYYIVGYNYKIPSKAETNEEVLFLVSKGQGIKHGEIHRWVNQTQDLIKGKLVYTYNDWRGGELANYDFT